MRPRVVIERTNNGSGCREDLAKPNARGRTTARNAGVRTGREFDAAERSDSGCGQRRLIGAALWLFALLALPLVLRTPFLRGRERGSPKV